MDYNKIEDRNSEQDKKSISEFYKVPYEDIRKKVFEVLNAHNVSEQTLEHLLNYIDTWDDLYKENKNVIEYLRANMPNEQPKKHQGWEPTLDVMLDS